MMGTDIPLGSLRPGDVIIDQEGDEAVFVAYSSTLYFALFDYEELGLKQMKMPISGLRLKERAP